MFMTLCECISYPHNGFENAWPDSKSRLKSCNLQQTECHGGCFTGPYSRKDLRKVDKLEKRVLRHVEEYVKAFRSFNDVLHACYKDELEMGYATKLLKMAKINKLFEKLYNFSLINWKLSQKALK